MMAAQVHDFEEAFTQLTGAIQDQIRGKSIIRLDEAVFRPFASTLTPVTSQALHEFSKVVGSSPGLLLRLDGPAVYLVISTVLHFPPSAALGKLAFYLIDTLTTYKDKKRAVEKLRSYLDASSVEGSLEDEVERRQKYIFSSTVRRLRNLLFDESQHDKTRRLVTQLIIALCVSNAQGWMGLMSGDDTQAFGSLLRKSTDYSLRILISDIVRHLKLNNFEVRDIWDITDEAAMDFPDSQDIGREEVTKMLRSMSDMDLRRATIQGSSRIYRIMELDVKPRGVHSSKADVLLVLDDELTIFMPDQTTGSTTMLSYTIPIKKHMLCESIAHTRKTPSLLITYQNDNGYWLFKGKKAAIDKILLVFTEDGEHLDVLRALQVVKDRLASSDTVHEDSFVQPKSQHMSIVVPQIPGDQDTTCSDSVGTGEPPAVPRTAQHRAYLHAEQETNLADVGARQPITSSSVVKETNVSSDVFKNDQASRQQHGTPADAVSRGKSKQKPTKRLLENEFIRLSQEPEQRMGRTPRLARKDENQIQQPRSTSPLFRVGKRKHDASFRQEERVPPRHINTEIDDPALTVSLDQADDPDYESFQTTGTEQRPWPKEGDERPTKQQKSFEHSTQAPMGSTTLCQGHVAIREEPKANPADMEKSSAPKRTSTNGPNEKVSQVGPSGPCLSAPGLETSGVQFTARKVLSTSNLTSRARDRPPSKLPQVTTLGPAASQKKRPAGKSLQQNTEVANAVWDFQESEEDPDIIEVSSSKKTRRKVPLRPVKDKIDTSNKHESEELETRKTKAATKSKAKSAQASTKKPIETTAPTRRSRRVEAKKQTRNVESSVSYNDEDHDEPVIVPSRVHDRGGDGAQASKERAVSMIEKISADAEAAAPADPGSEIVIKDSFRREPEVHEVANEHGEESSIRKLSAARPEPTTTPQRPQVDLQDMTPFVQNDNVARVSASPSGIPGPLTNNSKDDDGTQRVETQEMVAAMQGVQPRNGSKGFEVATEEYHQFLLQVIDQPRNLNDDSVAVSTVASAATANHLQQLSGFNYSPIQARTKLMSLLPDAVAPDLSMTNEPQAAHAEPGEQVRRVNDARTESQCRTNCRQIDASKQGPNLEAQHHNPGKHATAKAKHICASSILDEDYIDKSVSQRPQPKDALGGLVEAQHESHSRTVVPSTIQCSTPQTKMDRACLHAMHSIMIRPQQMPEQSIPKSAPKLRADGSSNGYATNVMCITDKATVIRFAPSGPANQGSLAMAATLTRPLMDDNMLDKRDSATRRGSEATPTTSTHAPVARGIPVKEVPHRSNPSTFDEQAEQIWEPPRLEISEDLSPTIDDGDEIDQHSQHASLTASNGTAEHDIGKIPAHPSRTSAKILSQVGHHAMTDEQANLRAFSDSHEKCSNTKYAPAPESAPAEAARFSGRRNAHSNATTNKSAPPSPSHALPLKQVQESHSHILTTLSSRNQLPNQTKKSHISTSYTGQTPEKEKEQEVELKSESVDEASEAQSEFAASAIEESDPKQRINTLQNPLYNLSEPVKAVGEHSEAEQAPGPSKSKISKSSKDEARTGRPDNQEPNEVALLVDANYTRAQSNMLFTQAIRNKRACNPQFRKLDLSDTPDRQVSERLNFKKAHIHSMRVSTPSSTFKAPQSKLTYPNSDNVSTRKVRTEGLSAMPPPPKPDPRHGQPLQKANRKQASAQKVHHEHLQKTYHQMDQKHYGAGPEVKRLGQALDIPKTINLSTTPVATTPLPFKMQLWAVTSPVSSAAPPSALEGVKPRSDTGDTTLVDESILQHVGLHSPSIMSASESEISATPEPDFQPTAVSSHHLHHRGCNDAQTSLKLTLQQTLAVMTEDVLIRIEEEEEAAKCLVEQFSSGCTELIDQFKHSTSDRIQHEVRKLSSALKKTQTDLEQVANGLSQAPTRDGRSLETVDAVKLDKIDHYERRLLAMLDSGTK